MFDDKRFQTVTYSDSVDALPCVTPVILRRLKDVDEAIIFSTVMACVWPSGDFRVRLFALQAIRTCLTKYGFQALQNLAAWVSNNDEEKGWRRISGAPLVELMLMLSNYVIADEEVQGVLRGLVPPWTTSRGWLMRRSRTDDDDLFASLLWHLDPNASHPHDGEDEVFEMPFYAEFGDLLPIVPGSGMDIFLLSHANELFPLNQTLEQNSTPMATDKSFMTHDAYTNYLVHELAGDDCPITPDGVCVGMKFLPPSVNGGDGDAEFTQ
jgi:hypothetical protein